MAKLKGAAKKQFVARMNRGRRKAGLKSIRVRNPRRRRRSGARARRRSAAGRFVVAVIRKARRHVRRRRSNPSVVTNPRRRRRRTHRRQENMAKRRRRRGSRQVSSRRRRRAAVLLVNPRRRGRRGRRRNPGFGLGAAGREVMKALVPGALGGAAMGFIDSKFLGDKSLIFQILGKLALAAGAGMFLRKRPAMAYATMGAMLGSAGYGFGVRAGGGVVAASAATGMKELAILARNDQRAMGLLASNLQDMAGIGAAPVPAATQPSLSSADDTDVALADAMARAT